MSDYFEFTTQKGITIDDMRASHPSRFYNQDWYLNEEFAHRPLDGEKYVIRTKVLDNRRGLLPDPILKLPSAGVATYAFLAYWMETGKFLWENDYTWTSDKDSHGDMIYVGGRGRFEIHRHLTLRQCHSVAPLDHSHSS